jgi:hypothetical protein
LVDVFNKFEDITFNFTVFSLMNFNSFVMGAQNPIQKLNISLITDAISMINNVTLRLDNNTVSGIRSDIITILKQVCID